MYDENLFEIISGTKLDKKNMTTINPTIDFVGRSSVGNGVTEQVDEIENVQPYPKGLLTLSLGGAYLGACFIQKNKFYTSQNVIVLKPRKKMSFSVKQFISVMIFKEAQTYYKAFENELNRHIKRDFSIPLPVTVTGEPNWEYMEKYMEKLENKYIDFINNI